MLNILVPTDFSDLSKVSVAFAIKLANKLNGKITFIHAVSVMHATRATMRERIEAMEGELLSDAQEEMDNLMNEVSKTIKTSKPATTRIARGTSFGDTIKREATRLKADIIVMGTRGASGLKKVVIGSNTASLIETSDIPVLVVPELAQFKGFKKIIYATDMRQLDREIKMLLSYVKLFESSIHVFHVAADHKAAGLAEEKIKKSLAKVSHGKFVIKVEVADKIDKAVEAYMKEAKGDLLTTFTHEHSFYEKLFDRSLTRKLAFQSELPLLAFRQK